MVAGIIPFQKGHEIFGVHSVKRTVLKGFQYAEVGPGVMKDKLVRIVIHHLQELLALSDNRNALSPRKNGGKESRNFYILFFSE